MWLKQSTATSFLVGPVLDASGLPVTTAGTSDFRISKAGTTAIFSGGTATHDTNGNYLVTLTTGNTDTIGSLEIGMHNTSMAMSIHRFMVLEPTIFDDLVSTATNASGGLRDVARINGQTVSAAASVTFPDTLASTTNITQATGVTLTAGTGLGNQTANITGNLLGSVGSVTSGVTVTTNNDKENYGLSATALTDIASAVWSAASRTLTGFGSLVTDVANAVWSAGTRTLTAFGFNVTVGGYAAGQSPPSANDIRDAVMNADPNGGWADGSFGDRWLISANNTRNLAITGSGHIAAVLHDAEPNSIPEDAFFTGAFSARVLADDAATEIATAVGNLQVLSRLDSMIESDGNGQFRFDTIALSMAAGGAGSTDWTANERTAIRSILGIPASGTTPADPSVGILDTIRDGVNSIGINVYPVTSSTPERVNGTTITVYKDEQTNVTISTTATLTGLTLRFVAEDRTGADVLVVENASFVARTATSVTLQIPSSVTDEIASYTWTLRDVTTGNSVLARGVLSVQAAASKNA